MKHLVFFVVGFLLLSLSFGCRQVERTIRNSDNPLLLVDKDGAVAEYYVAVVVRDLRWSNTPLALIMGLHESDIIFFLHEYPDTREIPRAFDRVRGSVPIPMMLEYPSSRYSFYDAEEGTLVWGILEMLDGEIPERAIWVFSLDPLVVGYGDEPNAEPTFYSAAGLFETDLWFPAVEDMPVKIESFTVSEWSSDYSTATVIKPTTTFHGIIQDLYNAVPWQD